MKKSDLKTGMLVQYRNGKVRMVINDTLIGSDNYIQELKFYNDDLTMNNHDKLCIKKVSEVLKSVRLMPKNWTEETLNENLLWERPKPIPELKTGMLVEYACGETGLVINNTILIQVGEKGDFGWNTTSKEGNQGAYEIIKISKTISDYYTTPHKWFDVLNNPINIIWSK